MFEPPSPDKYIRIPGKALLMASRAGADFKQMTPIARTQYWSTMAEETHEAVDYLRALKQSASPAGAREATTQDQSTSGASSDFGDRFQTVEKRRSRRYRCEGSAELGQEGAADVRTWATFSDVSLHGCYVEAQATYPVATILQMKLEANGFRVESKGIVRVNYPCLGMGIAFAEMSETNLEQLRQLLGTISRTTVVIGSGMASSAAPGRALDAEPPISDPVSALRALTEFFENRQMLMRDDFLKLLHKSQNPQPKP
jgi:hypothetical protein